MADNDIAQQVLKDRPNAWRRMKKLEEIAQESGTHGVFSANGAEWKRQRKLTAPAFTNVKIRGHYEAIGLVCDRFKNKWMQAIHDQNHPENGAVVDVLGDVMKFTLDIISLIAFGYDLNCVEKHSETAECLTSIMPFMHQRLTSIFPYWKFCHLPADKKFYRSIPIIKNLVFDIIEKSQSDFTEAEEKMKKNFIEIILQARQAGEDHLSDKEIFGNVLTLLLAGQDTTANTLAWCIHYLSTNQQVQEDLFKETSNSVNDTTRSSMSWYLPERDKVNNMTFTQNIIRETLRLSAPSTMMFLNPSDSPQTINFPSENLSVTLAPEDSLVLLNRKVATSHFGNTFDPHRWESQDESEIEMLKNISSIPFGGGPRVCPGKYLSYYESSLFLSMLSNHFIVEPEFPGVDTQELLSFTMGPSCLKARIKLR